jgi:Trypsin-like peptidase domain
MRVRVFLAVIFGFLTLSPPFALWAQEVDDPEQCVVEVRNENKILIGTGTVVSYDGLILTAKHVIIDHAESPEINFFAAVLVRFKNSNDYEAADVIAVHPYLDIAVLQLRRKAAQAAMRSLLTTDGLTEGQDVTLIGHVQRTEQLNVVKSAKIDQVALHGHLIVGRTARVGTSGGPVLVGGRLVGVVRSSGDDQTTVVPIVRALDFLRLMGVRFSADGRAYKTDDIAVLATRVEKYERILQSIQLDVLWIAILSRPANQSDIELDISYKRQLETAQPPFKARVSGGAGLILQNVTPDERFGFPLNERLDGTTVRFRNMDQEFDFIAKREKVQRKDFTGLNIKAEVSSIDGEGFIKNLPPAIYVCFHVDIPPGWMLRQTTSLTATGAPCKDEMNYLDKYIPSGIRAGAPPRDSSQTGLNAANRT